MSQRWRDRGAACCALAWLCGGAWLHSLFMVSVGAGMLWMSRWRWPQREP